MLFLDTSTERGIVVLMEGDQLTHKIELPVGYNNAQTLVPALESIDLSKIKRIGVGVGPGSYTGIRVGVVVAKTLAWSLKLPLVGVSTLMGFIPAHNGRFCALIDARVGGAYFLFGEKSESGVEYFGVPAVATLDVLVPQLQPGMTLVTPNARLLQQRISGEYRWEERFPDAAHLGRLAQQAEPLQELELLYLRKTQAEIERERGIHH